MCTSHTSYCYHDHRQTYSMFFEIRKVFSSPDENKNYVCLNTPTTATNSSGATVGPVLFLKIRKCLSCQVKFVSLPTYFISKVMC